MKVRLFEKEDLASVLAIQGRNPLAAQWKEADYERLAGSREGMFLVAELETMDPPKVLGFAAFQRVEDEAQLMNLAVDPEHQQQGVGRALVEDARKRLREAGAKQVFLEVRSSNKPAIGLYSSLGFTLHSQRKNYYQNPQEDAYVMSLDLVI